MWLSARKTPVNTKAQSSALFEKSDASFFPFSLLREKSCHNSSKHNGALVFIRFLSFFL